MNLEEYYKNLNLNNFEGFSQQLSEQPKILSNLSSKTNIKNILEIGFNGGHSSEIFLSSNPLVNIVSFDIGEHDYVQLGKKFLDEKYPNRHKLIIGDSTKTIPEYIKNNSSYKFDLIFIDGGHTYDVAWSDLINCHKLAHNDTIVIMDDTVMNLNLLKNWNIGPKRAWKEGINKNIINHINSVDFAIGRGMSWGTYKV
jgi:predicted O-methyltransferase YrrM